MLSSKKTDHEGHEEHEREGKMEKWLIELSLSS
jgi:hypothetical protein